MAPALWLYAFLILKSLKYFQYFTKTVLNWAYHIFHFNYNFKYNFKNTLQHIVVMKTSKPLLGLYTFTFSWRKLFGENGEYECGLWVCMSVGVVSMRVGVVWCGMIVGVVKRQITVYIVRIQDPNLKVKPWSINQFLVIKLLTPTKHYNKPFHCFDNV